MRTTIASLLCAAGLCVVPLTAGFPVSSATAAVAPAQARDTPFGPATSYSHRPTAIARLRALPTTPIAATTLPVPEGAIESPPFADATADSDEDEFFANSGLCADDEAETAAPDSAPVTSVAATVGPLEKITTDFAGRALVTGVSMAMESAAEFLEAFADRVPVTGAAVAVKSGGEISEAFADSAPATGVAVAEDPVVEIATDFASGGPVSGVATAVEIPDVLADSASSTGGSTTDLADSSQPGSKLDDMNGKLVTDQNGELMGTITAINDNATTAEVELINGRRIALTPEVLTDMGNGLMMVDVPEVSGVAAIELLLVDCE